MPNNIVPEGFEDDVTNKVATEHKYKNLIIDLFQSFGFKLIKTPLIEFLNTNFNHNVFQLKVKKNQKKLIVRNDITMQVARLSNTRLLNKNRPLKLCYYGEVVRKQGSMLRPERQFLQIGAECIGETSPLADIEMMDLAYSALSLVGIKNIVIEISSRVFLDKFFSQIKYKKNYNEIKKLIQLKDLIGILNILEKEDIFYIKDIFSCTGDYRDKKNNLDSLIIDDITFNEINNIKKIVRGFSKKNKKVKFFLDLCEVDDKNYHSGVRYTFFANNVRGEVAKGGRYIIKSKNFENKATGFTCYMDTILRASSSVLIQKKILIPFETSETKIKNLLNKGYTITKNLSNFKISKNLAKKQDCEFYLSNNSIKKI